MTNPVRFLPWFIGLLAGCTGLDDDKKTVDPSVPPAEIAENEQTLVWYDGQLVPACSVNYSRCLTGGDYEQCAWSVENPGGEDWFRGSCDSGYTCEQQGLEARCVDDADPPPSGDRTIHCVERSDGRLRVDINGELNGGTVTYPSDPYRLLYATDEDGRSDGWYLPYPSGTDRTYVSVGDGDGPYSFDLIPEADRFNFWVQPRGISSTPRANPPNHWFSLDGSTWTVTGTCHKEYLSGSGWALRRGSDSAPPPSGSQDPGTIVCRRTSSALEVSIRGPVLSRTVSAVTNPTRIEWGGNIPSAVWDTSRLSSNNRAYANWTSDTATYLLRLPRDASEFQFHVAGNSSNGWFALLPRNGVLPWRVQGDCYLNNDLIYRR